ncbi:tRNA (adenosine(37)-N6)-dimethylallyltransferase MiaA [Aquamicrobium zhengzhouense]|uniref:tRNA dimethylallyltransferase n=1 Tax=Aquamicrobium zhengzhouense TaxID=2781738 RepID=A0ABS0S8J3_9HYPH|nr:tRNA (adenosine(37)-N6)-dimethylallyltransferase MiaA [Aquamicrobium zhengzhouense]
MDESGTAAPLEPLKNAILIAGPTASGKSALAIRLALQQDGVIVNTDSMQVYSVLHHLTARPSAEDESRVPHRLYGTVSPAIAYSTGEWARAVSNLVRNAELQDKTIIFVGGTGLYFRALTEGLSSMPEVDPAIRQRWRDALQAEGAAKLHNILQTRDPIAAEAIRVTDGQRIVRALEVEEASGKPISWWQGQRGQPIVHAPGARKIVLTPDRAWLAERIGDRFDIMIKAGAMDEVDQIAKLDLDPALPAMKAIGLRELLQVRRGELSMADAVELAKTMTRQYAKRQSTWFRTQLDESWMRVADAHLIRK